MTTFTITVEKPSNGFENLHGSIKAIPFGLLNSTHAYPKGDEFVVELRAFKKNDAYNAATAFLDSFEGTVLEVNETTGKKTHKFF